MVQFTGSLNFTFFRPKWFIKNNTEVNNWSENTAVETHPEEVLEMKVFHDWSVSTGLLADWQKLILAAI